MYLHGIEAVTDHLSTTPNLTMSVEHREDTGMMHRILLA